MFSIKIREFFFVLDVVWNLKENWKIFIRNGNFTSIFFVSLLLYGFVVIYCPYRDDDPTLFG